MALNLDSHAAEASSTEASRWFGRAPEASSGEAELRALFAAMNEIVLVIGRDGRYLKVAPTSPELLLAPPEDLIGRTISEVAPNVAEDFLGAIARALESGVPTRLEYVLGLGGRQVWFEASIAPLDEESVLWVARDISAQKREQERREAGSAGLRAVLEATDELLQAPDLDTLLRRAVELAREKFGLERAAIFLLSPEGREVVGTFGTDIEGRTTDERSRRIAMPEGRTFRDFFAPVPEGKRWLVTPARALETWDGARSREVEQRGDPSVTLLSSAQGVIGSLHSDSGLSGRAVDAEQQDLVAVYCAALGNLIQSKRGEEALRGARDELERRVQARTSELSRANDDLQLEIQGRRRAQAQEEALAVGLRAVLGCADELLPIESLDALLGRAVELGRERLGLERCAIFLLTPDGKYLQGSYGINMSGRVVPQNRNLVPITDTWLASVRERPAERWYSMGEDAAYFDWDEGEERIVPTGGRGWQVVTPIRSAGGALGVMFNDSALSGAPLDAGAQSTVSVFASLLGSVIERKRAEGALRESERRFRQLSESLPQLVWTATPGGHISFLNAAAQKYFARPLDDLLGLGFLPLIHPEDLEAATSRWREAQSLGRAYTIESRLKGGDHQFRWHLCLLVPLRDEAEEVTQWVASATDIEHQKKAQASLRRDRDALERAVQERTRELQRSNEAMRTEVNERRQTEIALRHSEERFRVFMNASTFSAFMKNSDGRFNFVNEPLCRAFGITADQWLGRTLTEVLGPEARETEEHDAQVLEGDQTQTLLSTLPQPNGEERTWMTYKFPLRGGGGARYMGGLALDVTDQQRAERDLRLLTEELKRSNEDLEQFAYVASHDLQEPLRMVASYLQLLERRHGDKLDGSAREFLDFAVDGAKRMQGLINDLLDYSRVGRRGREFEPVDLDQVLQGILRVLSVAIEESGAQVEHEPLPTVRGDRSQLARLLQNLLANALKFRGESPPRISISCRDAGEAWEMCVRDNGIGIAPEHFERVFAVFGRLHGRDEYEGTGIGLAVVKKIVERHGGAIRVESEPGHGAAFWWTMPK